MKAAVLHGVRDVRFEEVARPELKKVLGWHFYDYKHYHNKNGNVIPLEYIVRLGVTSGSSILKKWKVLMFIIRV